ncbi:U11 U12 small nuclear ribonucleoprotein 48 kDa [Balamuthia mandrillaris]
MRKATTWQEAELKLKLLLKELRWTEEELFAGPDEEEDIGEEYHQKERKRKEEEDPLRSNETARKLLYADAPGVVCFPTSKFFDYSNCVAEAKRTKAARPDFKDASLDLFLSPSSSASASASASSSSTTTGDKTQLQLLAEQRDYKRRRRSYRAKNVHITKRTPIQVTRDFINKRMEELEAILQQHHEQEHQQTKISSKEEEEVSSQARNSRRRDSQSNQKRRREAENEDYYHHRG